MFQLGQLSPGLGGQSVTGRGGGCTPQGGGGEPALREATWLPAPLGAVPGRGVRAGRAAVHLQRPLGAAGGEGARTRGRREQTELSPPLLRSHTPLAAGAAVAVPGVARQPVLVPLIPVLSLRASRRR